MVDELRKSEEGRALLAKQAYDAIPKGTCPNCQAVIPPRLMKLRKSFQKYLKEDA